MDQMERPLRLAPDASSEAIPVPLTFEELFAAQHEKLFRALYLIVGSSHEAEELMQDALLRVLERWDRIENPAGYLYRTALNATRSRFRRLALAATRPPETSRSIRNGCRPRQAECPSWGGGHALLPRLVPGSLG